jgi:hypothetical protein
MNTKTQWAVDSLLLLFWNLSDPVLEKAQKVLTTVDITKVHRLKSINSPKWT